MEVAEIPATAFIPIGKALAYIHQSSYVHRDIKPSNIMLRNGDLSSPVLIDFGLAREFDPNQSLTMDSRLTEHFAPLEQYDLDSLLPHINVDRSQYKVRAWTDVYSLAATLYNLLTNQKPMVATFRQLSPKDFKSPQQLNPKISDRTNVAILKGMSLNPQDRSQSISEWLDLLSGKVLNNGLYRLIMFEAKKRLLSQSQLEKLTTGNQPPDGGIWTGTKVARWIETETGREKVWNQRGWDYLKKCYCLPDLRN